MRERQDASDVYVRIAEADLLRIPEFIALAKKYNPKFRVEVYGRGDTVIYDSDTENPIWIEDYDGGHNYLARENINIEAVHEFMIKYMDAHPEKPVELLSQDDVQVFEQRTLDGHTVKCRRFVGFHKTFRSWDDYAEIASLSGGNREVEGDDE